MICLVEPLLFLWEGLDLIQCNCGRFILSIYEIQEYVFLAL